MRKKHILSTAVFLLLTAMSAWAVSVTSGHTKAAEEPYSLRMLHNYKKASVRINLAPTTKANWLYGGSTSVSSGIANTEQGFLKLEKGNTAIVLRFQYKVKANAQPRIKTQLGL